MKPKWTLGDAAHRARSRASPWLLVVIPFGIVCVLGTGYAIGRIFNGSQYLFAPDGTFFCCPTLLFGAVSIVLSLLIGLPVGFTLANVCMWLVLPVRRGLDKANARANITFERSMKQLIPVAVFAILVGSPILLLVSNHNICFTDKEIAYRPFSLFQEKDYEPSQVSSVEKFCEMSKNAWGAGIVIKTSDGEELQVNRDNIWQPMPLARIMTLLWGAPFDNTHISPGCPRDFLKQLSPGMLN